MKLLIMQLSVTFCCFSSSYNDVILNAQFSDTFISNYTYKLYVPPAQTQTKSAFSQIYKYVICMIRITQGHNFLLQRQYFITMQTVYYSRWELQFCTYV